MERNCLRVKLILGGGPKSNQLCKKGRCICSGGQAAEHSEVEGRWLDAECGVLLPCAFFWGLGLECDGIKTKICPIMRSSLFRGEGWYEPLPPREPHGWKGENSSINELHAV